MVTGNETDARPTSEIAPVPVVVAEDDELNGSGLAQGASPFAWVLPALVQALTGPVATCSL